MRLVFGLGNPGDKYKNNRHNVGFVVVDSLKPKASNKIKTFKPDKFMNASGGFVASVLSKHPKVEKSDIYVIHDDLDIPLGSYKIQFGKGPKGHKGLDSINSALGTDNYWHVRVGVDNRDQADRIEAEEYVLQDFTKAEKEILNGVINKVVNELCKKLVM